MERRTRAVKRTPIIENDTDSEDEIPLKKLHEAKKKVATPSKKPTNSNDSSSESDIENYLQPIDKIDLSSSFFNIQKKHQDEFSKIEKDIFSGVARLSDSESEEDTKEIINLPENISQKPSQTDISKPSTSSSGMKLNFQQLEEYTRKIEEAKKHVEQYNAKKKAEEQNVDISNILAAGESKHLTLENIKPEDLHSSDFESCDSEREDWEEVKLKDSQEAKEKSLIPKDGVQITVNMPDTCRKKKGVDLLAAMKRRLNRIRKENQVYVHKVHLLCWIAHGNYVTDILNNTQILGLALSLLPSDKCYPPDRTDLSYLEQIVQWFKRTMKLTEKPVPKDLTLLDALQLQINKKEVFNKKMLVFIFVAIMRALGIQCRLVLSFQVEPLRPPVSELHSLAKEDSKKGVKEDSKAKKETLKSNIKNTENKGTCSNKKQMTKGHKKEGNSSHVKDKEASRKDANKINNKELKSSNSLELSNGKGKSNSVRSKDNAEKQINGDKDNLTKESKKTGNASNDTKNEKKLKPTTSEKESKEPSTDKRSARNKRVVKVDEESKESKILKKNILTVEKEKNTGSKSSVAKSKTEQTKTNNEPAENGTLAVEKEKNIRSRSADTKSITEQTRTNKASVGKNTLTVEKDKNSRSKSADNKVKTGQTTKKEQSEEKNSLTVEKEKNPRSKSADTKTKTAKTTKNELSVDNDKTRSKSEDNSKERQTRSKTTVKKDVIKVKLPNKPKPKKLLQLDGANVSTDDDVSFCIPQFDGADDVLPKKKKPNLKNLNNQTEDKCDKKKHPSRLKSAPDDYNSENEFRPRSPFTKKNADSPKEVSRKVNLHRLKTSTTDKVRSFSASPNRQLDVKNDIMNLIKGRIAEQKHIDRSRMVKKRKPTYEDDSDSDYMPEPIKKKHHDSDSDIEYFAPKPKVKQRVSFRNVKVDQKIVSSDSDTEKSEKKKKKGVNVWAEVFLENEEKWISVDLVHGQVHCVNELYTRATHPVSYIVAWNNDGYLKDITMRYCKSFNTITRKLRVDAKWWEETLKPFRAKYTAREKEEDDDLNRQQLDQPLPKSIAEYKNHPLYALRRHLLKFEEIYPTDVQPLGYVRGEPVYPRNCVYVCRSRDIWLKEARVVKPGEKPYKIVKARPKYDKLSNSVITDQLLEIFGIWQTTDYEPPTAENGIVPRNAFGNVELFKPCMLPKGTVHLKLPGLNKICKRMNIDCASAIVGFDFHGGWSHPTYDGFVVCEEHADVLVAAWELEQEELEKKETEKIEKRVYGNWKKLIRGLLIRERLKAKYDFGGTSGASSSKKKEKGPRFCTKKRRMYSDSESESDNK